MNGTVRPLFNNKILVWFWFWLKQRSRLNKYNNNSMQEKNRKKRKNPDNATALRSCFWAWAQNVTDPIYRGNNLTQVVWRAPKPALNWGLTVFLKTKLRFQRNKFSFIISTFYIISLVIRQKGLKIGPLAFNYLSTEKYSHYWIWHFFVGFVWLYGRKN